MEFKRSKYRLFEQAINEVSKRLSKLFNEIGEIKYNIHQPKETGPNGHEIFDNYSNWGTLVVEPNATYIGYELSPIQRYLAVYIDEKYLELEKDEFLKLVEKHFGKFTLRTTKTEYKNSSYRVFTKNSLDINFERNSREELFNNTNNHIIDFCIIFNGDYKKDQEKFDKYIKSLPPAII